MRPLALIVSIVFLDLLGFSLVIPLLPRYAESYGFSEAKIGLMMAAFPLCQFIAGPILGRLSDRYGRRPVLIASQLGTTIGFLMIGLSSSFWVLLFARAIDGASGGNILVAQAFIADITKSEDRAKSMGLLGAAFGGGFTLGPLLAGLLVSLPLPDPCRLRIPFLVAAGFSTAAWVVVWLKLPESRAAHAPLKEAGGGLSRRGLRDLLSNPGVGGLVLVGSIVGLAFAALEGTFSLFLGHRMHWTTQQAAYCFAFIGVIGILVQGGLIRWLVPRFREPRLIWAGVATLLFGFIGLASTNSTGPLLAAVFLISLGHGVATPAISGLLSRITPPSEQGAVFGTYTSLQTLARMLNYLIANTLLGLFGASAPYWEGAILLAIAFCLSFVLISQANQSVDRVKVGLDSDGSS
jgi:MFS family permease